MNLRNLAAGAAIVVGSIFSIGGTIAHAGTALPISWSTETLNIASAGVDQFNDVSLNVFKTSWAEADANLGNLKGSLNISFDWTVQAQGFYEASLVSIDTAGLDSFQIPQCSELGGGPASGVSACGNVIGLADAGSTPGVPVAGLGGLAVAPYGTVSGTFSEVVPVDGQTDLIFAVVPSPYSQNYDHLNTSFSISNLSLSPVPEPATWAMMLVGFGGLGALVRGTRGTQSTFYRMSNTG